MTSRLLRGLLLAALGAAAVLPTPSSAQSLRAPACRPVAAQTAWRLADLLPEVLCRDPRTRQTWALQRAQAARGEAQSALAWPRLEMTAGLGRASGSAVDAPGGFAVLGLDLNWLLYDGGQRAAGQAAVRQALLEAMASHDLAVQTVLLDAVQAYLSLRDEDEHLRLQLELQGRYERLLAELRRRRVPAADLLELRWAMTQAAVARHEAVQAQALARGRLAQLLGLPPDQAPRLFAETGPEPVPAVPPVSEAQLQQWLDLAQRQHPEALAALARAEGARAEAEQASRAGQPSLSLNWNQSRTQYPRWPHAYSREAALQLSLPLFDGGARAAQAGAASAEQDAAAAALDEVRQRIAQGVWEAYQELLRAAAVRRETLHAAAIARHLRQEAEQHAADPDAEFTDLLEAQERDIEARLERQRARSAWELAHWRLAQAVGRLQTGLGPIALPGEVVPGSTRSALPRAVPAPPAAAPPISVPPIAASPIAASPLTASPIAAPPVPAVRPAAPGAASGGAGAACRAGAPEPADGWCVPR
ncbi:MAG: TolC family protein [Burkholderiaceae bacterium]|nr:TolC family protein [Burkholderiaceae bacterium]